MSRSAAGARMGRTPSPGNPPPPLLVRFPGSDRSLPAGPSYTVGRDPECDLVLNDARVSWQHALLRLEDGRWVLKDNSSNGTYHEGRRVDRIEISGECLVRLGDPGEGPVLKCTVSGDAQGAIEQNTALSPLTRPSYAPWLAQSASWTWKAPTALS